MGRIFFVFWVSFMTFTVGGASARSESHCAGEGLRAIEDLFFDDVLSNLKFYVEVGKDGDEKLQEVYQIRSAHQACWDETLKQNPKFQAQFEKFEQFVKKPLSRKLDLNETSCKGWVHPTLSTVPKAKQHAYGSCFAHGLSDLLSAQYGEEIAPYEIFVSYAKNRNETRLPLSGEVADALEDVQKSGTPPCLSSNFHHRDPTEVEMFLSDFMATKSDEQARKLFLERRTLFKYLSGSDIDSVLKEKGPIDRLQVFLQKACRERAKRSLLPKHSLFLVDKQTVSGGVEGLLSIVDSSLNRKQPVLVGSFSGGIPGHFLSIGEKLTPFGKRTDHVSVVIGRRFNKVKGRCEYLIRDSAVSGCVGVAKSLDCDEKTGHTWIPRVTLGNAAVNVQSMQGTMDALDEKSTPTSR